MEESGYKTEVRLRGLAGKSRVLKPAQAGFVCVAAVSTALLRMVQDLSREIFVISDSPWQPT